MASACSYDLYTFIVPCGNRDLQSMAVVATGGRYNHYILRQLVAATTDTLKSLWQPVATSISAAQTAIIYMKSGHNNRYIYIYIYIYI